ncbi:hypothetical protein C4K15_4829 [Pseudomonas chlororaphis subsp. aurantiaca]|nr:hypothetical protein C4K15_4829 [Pseudomonas chlororaphis subsp. aurantiaca]
MVSNEIKSRVILWPSTVPSLCSGLQILFAAFWSIVAVLLA